MNDQSVEKTALLRIYDAARKSLDPLAAVEHVAGVTGVDLVVVESAIQNREAWEVAPC